jgi:phosphoribosylformylglycinamidine synthase
MWAFSEVIDGMAEACRAFDTPVISGNVSFYNETEGRGIHPTPVVGMVGLVEDVRRIIQPGFKREGDLVALFGTTGDDLSIGEYASVVEGRTTEEMINAGRLPALDLARELAVQRATLAAAEEGLLRSAHDCSDGGLAVALAESCFSTLNRPALGAQIALTANDDDEAALSHAAHLFAETPSRIVVSFDEAALARLQSIAESHGAPLRLLGRVGGQTLQINAGGEPLIDARLDELESEWRTSLARKLSAEAIASAAE